MDKINLFVYWIGDETIKKEIVNKFNNLCKKYPNLVLNIGPTKEEIDFMINNFSYYKKMYKENRHGFASDIYRFWKLSENNGIYIDALTNINEEKFEDFINLFYKQKHIVIKENGHLIWNGIIASKNQPLFKKIINFYINNPKIAHLLTGPLIYSIFIYKSYGIKLNENENGVYYLNATDVDPFDNDSFFNYNGIGSWRKNIQEIDFNNRIKTGGHNYFHKNALKFKNKGFNKSWIIIRWCIKNYLIIYWLPCYFKNRNKQNGSKQLNR